jgi:membrane protein DedA with SNARE-associated domain
MELLQEFAREWIAEFTYLGPFLLLILCGFGLPLPEEVSLIGGGLLLYEGEAEFAPMLLACVLGVLGGDAIPYMVGRRWGKQALRHRWVNRLLDRRRMLVLERRFRAHRNWGTFTTRFFPGLRWPGYFLAGSLQVPPWRWFLLDLAGALIQVPLVLALGRAFGESIDGLENRLDNLHLVLGLGALLLTGGLVLRARLRRRNSDPNSDVDDPAAEADEEPGQGAGGDRPAPAAPARTAERQAARAPGRAAGSASGSAAGTEAAGAGPAAGPRREPGAAESVSEPDGNPDAP